MSAVISNFINQYLVSESFKSLNKNMIGLTSMREGVVLGSGFLKKDEEVLK